MDYQYFFNRLAQTELASWLDTLPQQIQQGLDHKRYGDLARWQTVLEALPTMKATNIQLDSPAIRVTGDTLDQTAHNAFIEQLQGLHPWRKGPFHLFGVDIDTEWRSDVKWDRLKNHIEPLTNRKVLDIGCGSGYHCWRMRGAGAELVVGIDPTPLFIMQFFTLQKYIQDPHIAVLPLGIEQLPKALKTFDTTFSMGVLYHRRSPIDHLIELRETLRPEGQLVLETLVIEGNNESVLVPEGRYAKMGNVWFIPSTSMLTTWLKKTGFKNINVVDESYTTSEEQRSTDWMHFHSLAQFLNPDNRHQTIEGYPAPKRAVIVANAAR